jgi:predicted class III extradiol MEMO1 family dioxygenase
LYFTVNGELEMTGQFEWMDLDTDENEHSIEMHLPYIAKVMEKWVLLKVKSPQNNDVIAATNTNSP